VAAIMSRGLGCEGFASAVTRAGFLGESRCDREEQDADSGSYAHRVQIKNLTQESECRAAGQLP